MRHRSFGGLLAGLLLAGTTGGLRAATPMEAPLPEGQTTPIECEYAKDEPDIPRDYSGIAPDKGTYHYNVYVPEGYAAQAPHRYPCVFIADPGGSAHLGNLEARVKRDHWIAVMLVESKNGPFGPIAGNFLAAHDDAVKRLRIQEGLKFTTGMSGGARASSVFAGLRPGFAGAVLQGAGFAGTYASVRRSKALAIYATFGDKDGNVKEVDDLKRHLAGVRFQYAVFPGGHEWAPVDVIDRAWDWMEEQALFNSGPVSAGVAAHFFGLRMARVGEAGATPMAKLETLAWLDKLAVKAKLEAAPETKDQVKQVRDQLKDIRQDAALKLEVVAFDAYARAKEKEAILRNAFGPSRPTGAALKQAQTTVLDAYKAVADKHKDTEYGKKAEERMGQLNKEYETAK